LVKTGEPILENIHFKAVFGLSHIPGVEKYKNINHFYKGNTSI
jgi:hypothetical protein